MEAIKGSTTTTGSLLVPPKKDLSAELLERAKKASSATISGELSKRGFRFVYMAGVLPLKPGTVFAGRAYALRINQEVKFDQ